jgi:oxalate decarboxylase family bicupin protein
MERVNVWLTSGGIRELHWHEFAEWAYVIYGTCRRTVLDPAGQAYAAGVNERELWIFPPGYPHSLQGIGEDGTEFILAFNEGKASEFNTLLVTDFLARTPPDILSQNFQAPVDTFSRIPTYDRYIFHGELPGSLAADQAAILSPESPSKNSFSFSLKGVKDKPFFRQGPGNTELQFLEVFKSPIFQDVSLSDWLTHTPPAMVAATFNIDAAVIAKWPKDKPETLPLYQG